MSVAEKRERKRGREKERFERGSGTFHMSGGSNQVLQGESLQLRPPKGNSVSNAPTRHAISRTAAVHDETYRQASV